jgi:hypothetical protein
MPQSNWTAIVARIVSQIRTIANIGVVHEGRRLIVSEAALLEQAIAEIGGESRLRMWTVHLEGMPSTWADASGSLKWKRKAVVEGFLQFEADGASEKAGLALAESIIRTLATDLDGTKLNSTVLSGDPPSLETNEPRLYGPVLAHFVRLTMPLLTIEQ